MKKTAFILTIIITIISYANVSIAQKNKVTLVDDTVKVDGKPYAILTKKNAGPMRSDYIVSGLAGTELIYFKSNLRNWTGSGFRFGSDELYYEANFIATGSQAELSHYTASGFAKLIVDNNLVKENAIDPESEKRFIRLNNGYTPSVAKSEPENKTPAVVVNINNNTGGQPENNSNTKEVSPPKSKSPVTISGNQIIRDEVVIGKFRQDTTSSAYSQKTVVIVVYSEGGEKVAEATAPVVNPQEWNIKVVADNKTFNILYDSPNEREKLFKWLADKNYLMN